MKQQISTAHRDGDPSAMLDFTGCTEWPLGETKYKRKLANIRGPRLRAM